MGDDTLRGLKDESLMKDNKFKMTERLTGVDARKKDCANKRVISSITIMTLTKEANDF